MSYESVLLDLLLDSSSTQEGVIVIQASTGEILRANRCMQDFFEEFGHDLILTHIHDPTNDGAVIVLRQQSASIEARLVGMDAVEVEVKRRKIGTDFVIVSLTKRVTYKDLWQQTSTHRFVEQSIPFGLVEFHLDTTTGASTAAFFNPKELELTGCDSDILSREGIVAIGNRCHSEDLAISDFIAMHQIKKLESFEWLLRMRDANDVFRWRRYSCHSRTVDGRTIAMVCSLHDYTDEANRMGLTDSPSVKIIELPDGSRSFIPVVSCSSSTHEDDDQSDLPDIQLPGDSRSDVVSLSTQASRLNRPRFPSDANFVYSELIRSCQLKRKMLNQLISCLNRDWGSEPNLIYLMGYERNRAAIEEELLLISDQVVQQRVARAIRSNDFIAVGQHIAPLLGFGNSEVNWLTSTNHVSFNSSPSDVVLTIDMFLCIAGDLDCGEAAKDLLMHLSRRIDDISCVIGEAAGSVLAMHLSLCAVEVANKHRAVFEPRPTKAWLGTLVSRAVNGIESEEVTSCDLLLQIIMYWLSMQWGLFLECPEVLSSCIDDLDQFIEDFPEAAVAPRLRAVIAHNHALLASV